MTYRHTIHLHGDYLDGELSPEQRDFVTRHLADCANCRNDLEKLRLLTQALKRVTTPNPGRDYFDNLTGNILARTESILGQEINSSPVTSHHSSGRQVLTALIRLATAVTLLFAAFYISDLNQEKRATRWAEHIKSSNYVTSDGTGPEGQVMPPAGIKMFLGMPSPDDQVDDPQLKNTVEE